MPGLPFVETEPQMPLGSCRVSRLLRLHTQPA